ncbi:MAG: glycosyltransferase family 8 protein [Pelagibacterales bacterium]|nr:glycosyltransferase family 8 protein [Pelagibacterales bacterium]
MKDLIHVAYCFDQNYEQHAAVSIFSLLNNSKIKKIFLHLVSYKLTNNFKNFLNDMKEKFDFHYKFYDFEQQRLLSLKKTLHEYVSIFENTRLFLPELIKNDTSRVIYLDSDTIILDDISDLYYLNLDSNYIAQAPDYSSDMMMNKISVSAYFNSGVILFDVSKWINEKITEKLLSYESQNKDRIYFGPQCLLSLFFENKILKLEKKYNYFILSGSCQKLVDSFEAKIIHFIRDIKPWHKYFDNENMHHYQFNLLKTIYRESKPKEPKNLLEWKHYANYLFKKKDFKTSLQIFKNILLWLKTIEPDNINQISRLEFQGEIFLSQSKEIETLDLYRKFFDVKFGPSDYQA